MVNKKFVCQVKEGGREGGRERDESVTQKQFCRAAYN